MAILGFSTKKITSIVLLLVCIVGSLLVDSLMKSQEGFQEGAENKGPSDEKELKKAINDVLDDNKNTPKESINKIQDIIAKYINNNEINTTVNQVVNILNLKADKDEKVNNNKKINMIAVLLSK